MTNRNIAKAKIYLEEGHIIALPTETVYGLAGNAYQEEVIKKIFDIKKRPLTSPLIVHSSSLARLPLFVKSIPLQAMRLAEAFWPGPLTLLLEKKNSLPSIVTAGLSTVGVRVPRHPLTLELLQSLPFPLAAPSANPFGYLSPTRAEHVEVQLGSHIPYILDGGPCQVGLESTIIGFQEGHPLIYRLGSLTKEEIEAVIGPITYLPPAPSQQGGDLTPGRTKHHYAPRTPLLVGELPLLLAKNRELAVAALSFDHPLPNLAGSQQIVLSTRGSLVEAARNLFEALHQLDALGADLIIAPIFPDQGLGRVMNERLQRASRQPI